MSTLVFLIFTIIICNSSFNKKAAEVFPGKDTHTIRRQGPLDQMAGTAADLEKLQELDTVAPWIREVEGGGGDGWLVFRVWGGTPGLGGFAE